MVGYVSDDELPDYTFKTIDATGGILYRYFKLIDLE